MKFPKKFRPLTGFLFIGEGDWWYHFNPIFFSYGNKSFLLLSCYWPNFHETLKVGSWEHLEHIPTVTVTFVQTTFLQVTFVHIRNIRFWQQFKVSFLGPPTVRITFAEAKYVLATFLQISNISVVNDQILTFGTQFFGGLNFSVIFFSTKLHLTRALIFAKVIKFPNMCPGDICIYQQCLRY